MDQRIMDRVIIWAIRETVDYNGVTGCIRGWGVALNTQNKRFLAHNAIFSMNTQNKKIRENLIKPPWWVWWYYISAG